MEDDTFLYKGPHNARVWVKQF